MTERAPSQYRSGEPTQIVSGKRTDDGGIEIRLDTVARAKPAPDGTPGAVDYRKSKDKARNMINKGAGIRVDPAARRKPQERRESAALQMLLLSGLEDHGNAIRMNLLAKSGLVENRVVRDLNILEGSVKEASHHMRHDDLRPALDRHFGLDNLKDDKRAGQADGCTIAALLLMNAAMLHQRIANGEWIAGVSDLETVKNEVNVVVRVRREWQRIMLHDFRPVLEPAVAAVEAVEDTGKLAGLERALRHITAEAERIAETYADMGADHAGPLFNRVMGNQASDGAYFTRPAAAAVAARLTLDACGGVDWTAPRTWREHKTVDPACGSGTLLAAMLADMKRRAREGGADDAHIAGLQRLAVEDTVKGLDINPVSLQLAASQLTAGNRDIRYQTMGLHLMPYGPSSYDSIRVSVGTLELLGQKAVIPRDGELDLPDDNIGSRAVWTRTDDAELEDAVDAVKDARIVIMNPPFTNRIKMGEKFPEATQQALRARADGMERVLIRNDADMDDFTDKNSIRPLFVALADKCIDDKSGVLAMIVPTIALSAPSGLNERRILARRYHIHTVLTCHRPGQANLSHNTNVNESVIVARRHDGPRPPTRFVNLDRMPVDEAAAAALHDSLARCEAGPLADGWGEVSLWPAQRSEAGDWTAAIWRSPELAEAARGYADDTELPTIKAAGLAAAQTGRLLSGPFEPASAGAPGRFPILKSKGADGQTTIRSTPDAYWTSKRRDEDGRRRTTQLLEKSGYLLMTAGQDNRTGRLTATAGDEKFVGDGWMPVTGLSAQEAKALAVFVNATPGRLQLMRTSGRKLDFPNYRPAGIGKIRVPNFTNARIRRILADCWERTRDMEVPQFRDGECEVRRLWDDAVAEAMGWDAADLARQRELLNNEPHVRGLGYDQYADADEDDRAQPNPD